MALEILTFGTPSQRPPLLFVHGAYSAAWVWAEHMLAFFAESGWSGAAVSLRGHGGSDGAACLDLAGLDDYVADVRAAAAPLGRPPVLIGHSMGGLVVQLALGDLPAAGLVLLSSLPPSGLAGSAQMMGLFRPMLVWQLSLLQAMGAAADPDVVIKGLFSPATPRDRAMDYLTRFQRESKRAAWEAMIPRLWTPPCRLPALVLGGDDDAFIPQSDMRDAAAFWNARRVMVPGLPHAFMLDETWRQAADPLRDWLARGWA